MADDKMIRERAYHIWEAEGRPHGRDREHWERASREIAAEKTARPRKAPGLGAGAKRTGKPKARPAGAEPR